MTPSKIHVVANVIMGNRPEPFLAYCLESVADAVDRIILNDNSNDPDNPNLKTVCESRIWREGRVKLLTSRLEELGGFHGARNLCLQAVPSLGLDGEIWILYLDTDEVHADNFRYFLREFLPHVPPTVGMVDGYMYQFIQSFDYYYSIDHRHNLLFRYTPDIHWVKPIHSELMNLRGIRLSTPYRYFHYGYVYPPENILRRFTLYREYDSFDGHHQSEADVSESMLDHARLAIPFRDRHPSCIEPYVATVRTKKPEYILAFDELVERQMRDGTAELGGRLRRDRKFRNRLTYRAFQTAAILLCHLRNGALVGPLMASG